MTEHGAGAPAASDGSSPGAGAPARSRPRLRTLATGLWHQRPGPRSPRPASPRPAGEKEIVNGLDRRERLLGAGAVALAIAFTVAGYLVNHRSTSAQVRADADTLLVAGSLVTALMLVGLLLRRRALLGFASFMTGMEAITGRNTLGILFLLYGGWLIMRVMARQRQQAGAAAPAAATRRPARAAGPPRASKRYTPPRRRPTAARKR
ncbi:MAG TPA: hypothetical protein VKV23_06450 [Acidimicrobiales bacterium]|nr:hypothetical protein [Acidimicrobiales bacterium]